jgi:hypothetical protein
MDKEKIVPAAKIYIFSTWPIMGLGLLIFGIVQWNSWERWQSLIAIIIGIFLLGYGIWVLKRSILRLRK